MKKEIWKDVYGYKGFYQASSKGRIRSLARISNGVKVESKILSSRKRKDGYIRVCFHKDGLKKYYYAHRLVAIAFKHNPKRRKQVNHIDGNRQNNHSSNLEWCTALQNTRHSIQYLGLTTKARSMVTQN